MTAPPPSGELPKNKQITNDLKEEYKTILEKHLDGRTLKEDKINSWMNNILSDAKEYFLKKYPDYNLFLYIYVCPRDVYFYSYTSSISVADTDWNDSIVFTTDNLYSCLYFFFYEECNLNYEIEDYENLIVQNGNEILKKYLQDRNYGEECKKYNEYIINEYIDFILNKEKYLRCYFISRILKNTEKNKYFYKYISLGKKIYSKIIYIYENDSLVCMLNSFFFK